MFGKEESLADWEQRAKDNAYREKLRRQKLSQEEKEEEDLRERIRNIVLERERSARDNRPIILLDGDNW